MALDEKLAQRSIDQTIEPQVGTIPPRAIPIDLKSTVHKLSDVIEISVQAERSTKLRSADSYLVFVPYGLWLVGFSETPASLAAP